jgi:hypothetical protein
MTAPGPKKPKLPNLVREALRTATNRPPRACAHVLDIIAEYADQWNGHNAFAGTGTLMKRTRGGERQTREKLQRLRDGHWIDVQDGPDTEIAKASYAKRYRKEHPLHRPAVYRVVLQTLRAAPGSIVHDGTFKGCTVCYPPSRQRCGFRTSQPENQRCGNGQFRGAETDTAEVRLAADIPSFHSKTASSRSTDSLRNKSLRETPPDAAGGTALVPLDPRSAPRGEPGSALRKLSTFPMTEKERERTLALTDARMADGFSPEDLLLISEWGDAQHRLSGQNGVEKFRALQRLDYLWGDRCGEHLRMARGWKLNPRGDKEYDSNNTPEERAANQLRMLRVSVRQGSNLDKDVQHLRLLGFTMDEINAEIAKHQPAPAIAPAPPTPMLETPPTAPPPAKKKPPAPVPTADLISYD